MITASCFSCLVLPAVSSDDMRKRAAADAARCSKSSNRHSLSRLEDALCPSSPGLLTPEIYTAAAALGEESGCLATWGQLSSVRSLASGRSRPESSSSSVHSPPTLCGTRYPSKRRSRGQSPRPARFKGRPGLAAKREWMEERDGDCWLGGCPLLLLLLCEWGPHVANLADPSPLSLSTGSPRPPTRPHTPRAERASLAQGLSAQLHPAASNTPARLPLASVLCLGQHFQIVVVVARSLFPLLHSACAAWLALQLGLSPTIFALSHPPPHLAGFAGLDSRFFLRLLASFACSDGVASLPGQLFVPLRCCCCCVSWPGMTH